MMKWHTVFCMLLVISKLEQVDSKLEGNPPGKVWEPQERKLTGLTKCQGDCQKNDDCATGLECYMRDAGDPCPPACSGCNTAVADDLCVPAPTPAPVSTPAPVAPAPGTDVDINGCFSAQVEVHVEGKGSVPMKDLQVGDQVLTAGRESNNTEYQAVYAFGHYHPTKTSYFLQIFTEGNHATPLEITKEHLVFMHGKINPVRADSIQVGDILQGEAGGIAVVTQIRVIQQQGMYAPFTQEGTIVVNGIKVSSYISLQEANEFVELQGGTSTTMLSQHDYVHLGLSPFRLLCQGVSSKLCKSYNEDGMPYYIAFAINLNKWAHSQNIVVESMVMLLILILTGVCMMLETTFGGKLVPSVTGFSIALGTYLMTMKHRINNSAGMKKQKAL